MLSIFLPRGIRNNNPGNIRSGKIPWQGQKTTAPDAVFVEFSEPVFGLRALMRVLLTYYCKYGLNTVDSIINRYAPPRENATDHYARCVAVAMKIRRTQSLFLCKKEILVSLARAIVRQENGLPPPDRPDGWYPPDLYDQAAQMALSSFNQTGKEI